MTETIDKLVYALDGDPSGFKRAAAEVETTAQRTGRTVSESLSKPLQDASTKTQASAQAVKASLNETTAAAAKQRAELDTLRATYDRGFAAQQKFAKTQQDVKMLLDAGVISTRAAEAALKDAAKAAETFAKHGTRAGSQVREGMVLVHEFMRGDWKRAVGSATIELQNFGVLGKAGIAAAVLAIPALLITAAVQSDMFFAKVQRQIMATGYAAGVTRDQLLGMAIAADQGSRLSQHGAMETGLALISRGNVGGAQLPSAMRAAHGLSLATGTGQEKASEELEKLLADPAKGAQALQEQFKLLSVAQQKEIEHLQASGEKALAQQMLIDAVNDRFADLKDASWSLAKTFDGVGKSISDFWTHTGDFFTGHGKTTSQQVSELQAHNATTLASLASVGINDPRGTLAAHPSTGVNVGGGIMPLRNIMADFDATQARIDTLTHNQTIENQKAKGGEYVKEQREAVGQGVRLNEQYDEQATRIKTLTEQQAALNKALGMAIGPEVKFQDGIRQTRDAVKVALDATKKYGSPEFQSQQHLLDQQKIAAAPRDSRETVRQQVAAEEHYRQNLMNPTTSLQADKILKNDLAAARFNRMDANRRDEQNQNLRAMQNQADAAEQVAKAYDDGTGAVERAKAVGEAHTALIQRHINNEDAYAKALEKRAFWQAQANTAQTIQNATLANAGLASVVAAGGDPVAVAKARRVAEARQQTAPEFNAATTPEAHMKAFADYKRVLSEIEERDRQNALIQAQGQLRGQKNDYQHQQQTAALFFSGGTEDDLRRLKVAQDVFDQLVQDGLDPTTEAFHQMYEQMVPLAVKASDLAVAFQKAKQYAAELAEGITSPIKRVLTGKEKPMDALSDIGENTADTLIQHQIIDPMNKWLEGMLGNAIGISADGTMSSPYYVIPVGAGGLPGVGGVPPGGGVFGPGGIFGGAGQGNITNGVGLPPGWMNMSGGSGAGEEFGGGDFIGTTLANMGGLGEDFGGGDFIGTSADPMAAGGGAFLSGLSAVFDEQQGSGGFLGLLGGLLGGGGGGGGGGAGGGLSSLLNIGLMFAGMFDEGGTIPPGHWGVKSGIPEIVQGGTAGVSVMPITAPVVAAAIGSATNGAGRSGGGNSNGAPPISYAGDTHNWHLPGVQNVQDFVRARSQLEGVASVAADRGKRNR